MWTLRDLDKRFILANRGCSDRDSQRTNEEPNGNQGLKVLRASKDHGEDAPYDLHGRYLPDSAVLAMWYLAAM